jgi:hypothetical protein
MIEESIRELFKKILIEFTFQLPISWVWVGQNGGFMTGRIEVSKLTKEPRSVILSGNPKKLKFPVNIMLVDARGDAAHVLLKESGEIDGVNRLRVDEPPPEVPPRWPISFGKA